MTLLIFILLVPSIDSTISCFSCASADYQKLMESNRNLAGRVPIRIFDSACESNELRQINGDESSCQTDSTCITLYENYYVGGMQVEDRPFTVIRGCTDKILNYVDNINRPREIDFLHEGAICVHLALSTIFPQVTDDLTVRACSCIDDDCNRHLRPSHYSSSSSFSLSYSILSLISLIYL
ncbi:hot-5 [Pristionchus pacificus]|uniref:Hot-5 n=1 Tax=Pristionchus pacificus TaxID=54126 RepID=A0A2A6BKM8_PRIPA|nr:hot-5 [Pristionchus pacificus]|eukprot:PDM66341.1 hot-5 [Pristionchus pacificus]